jgi:hypothetical protein
VGGSVAAVGDAVAAVGGVVVGLYRGFASE